MSKLSQLKQEAYQAGKKRDWDRAVSIYEQILELDKSNPTLINELGDLCLKTGNTARGIKHFLGAAGKYRQTGLLNNAVAIYKKILRYDQDNQNAHWYLAESRASQGLLVDGEQHALSFMGTSDKISSDIKEIFLKRCVQLMDLYPNSQPIQDNLLQVFRLWEMPQEAGRVQIQMACRVYDQGNSEKATALVESALAANPELANYPEHGRWQERIGATTNSSPVPGFGEVSLEDAPLGEPVPETPPSGSETSFADISLDETTEPTKPETSFADLSPAAEEVPAENEITIPEAPDDSGCFDLDLDEETSLDDILAQAAAGVSDSEPDVEVFSENPVEADIPVPEAEAPVNLLDDILADTDGDGYQPPEGEVKTISEEIGSRLGGDNSQDDPESLYEMGMVYLEMGLSDQACESFEKASRHGEYAVRAHEMWGITLLRVNKTREAIAVLNTGLKLSKEGSRENLGLIYNIACAHEQAGRTDEAQRLFFSIQERDPGFLDVGRRLAKLTSI